MNPRPYLSLISARCPWRLSVRVIHDHHAGADYLGTARAVRMWVGPLHFEFGLFWEFKQ